MDDAHRTPGSIAIEERIGAALRARGWQIATAESCTGGLLASRLTDVPGSSEYFLGGVIAYANEAKEALLGVRAATLERHGAVSAACAREMAQAALQRFEANLALAVTGIAGPGGGTPGKPVGLTYIAVARARDIIVERHHFAGDRGEIKRAASETALALALRLAGTFADEDGSAAPSS